MSSTIIKVNNPIKQEEGDIYGTWNKRSGLKGGMWSYFLRSEEIEKLNKIEKDFSFFLTFKDVRNKHVLKSKYKLIIGENVNLFEFLSCYSCYGRCIDYLPTSLSCLPNYKLYYEIVEVNNVVVINDQIVINVYITRYDYEKQCAISDKMYEVPLSFHNKVNVNYENIMNDELENIHDEQLVLYTDNSLIFTYVSKEV